MLDEATLKQLLNDEAERIKDQVLQEITPMLSEISSQLGLLTVAKVKIAIEQIITDLQN